MKKGGSGCAGVIKSRNAGGRRMGLFVSGGGVGGLGVKKTSKIGGRGGITGGDSGNAGMGAKIGGDGGALGPLFPSKIPPRMGPKIGGSSWVTDGVDVNTTTNSR
jgi:hypothetical protein